jgi:hypothetical protein
MIDFNAFELDSFSKILWSLKDYTNNNLRYPKAGELVEIAYDVCSKGKLKRVNLPGVDLIGEDEYTYESKVTQFKNKSQMAVRNVILKNSRSKDSINEKLADFFIFTDIKQVVTSSMITYDADGTVCPEDQELINNYWGINSKTINTSIKS